MEILSFDSLESTQNYLIDAVTKGELKPPIAVIAKEQSSGVGSRDNEWIGVVGNLFFSFALALETLPKDLKIESASLYFSFIMKELLSRYRDDIYMKWPNDIYIHNQKIGGTITKKIEKNLICGIGINIIKSPNSTYGCLEVAIDPLNILQEYIKELKKMPSWKQIFIKYQIEFEKYKNSYVHINNYQKSLSSAQLCEDGSIIINKKRMYSLR
ncbi:MAG: biotin--[acetyl-CoA-carboxylase] ligase [Campylobacterales bacterium]|nr:biotin--[acetyl-CoA-carboxylase] ligase [Campylobacterales bacterium]